MKIFKLLIIIYFLLLTSITYSNNEIKYYGPKQEKLTGTVRFLTFPGRPNFTSIKEGDEPERQRYLFLDKAIDLKMKLPKDKRANVYDDEANIKLVQLIIPLKDYKLIKEGQRITVKGELFGAIFGHHHA